MSAYKDINPKFDNNKLVSYDLETNEDAIKNSLLNIFAISKGEVPGKPKFGNPIDLSVFDLFNFFDQKHLEAAIENVIANYEPRVNIEGVSVIKAEEFNRIII